MADDIKQSPVPSKPEGEEKKAGPTLSGQPEHPLVPQLLNQKELDMKTIHQGSQDAREELKPTITKLKTPESKLLAGAKATAAAVIIGTTGMAQDVLKPKTPTSEIQLAPTETVTETELFTLAKYRDRDRLERWPTLTPEQKSRVLQYFSLGKKMNLDERGMKRLGLKLMSFYETANEQKKIIMGDDSIKSVLSLTIIGGELEEIFPGAGFAKKGAELDAVITKYLSETTAELRKESAELRKESAELRKRTEEKRKQGEILDMLIKRLEKL